MKNFVKTLVLVTCLQFFSIVSGAQLKLPALNGFAADLKKVIRDQPNHFSSMIGDIIAEHPQSTDYECKLAVSNTEENYITRYSSLKEIYSWQALVLTTESFEKAKQKFRALYNQLNNLAVPLDNGSTLHFKGSYTTPAEESKFISVLLNGEPEAKNPGKLVLELSLQFYQPMEWKVKVLVYDREREDAEKGAAKEGQ